MNTDSRQSGHEPAPLGDAGTMGMYLLVLALGMLFAASGVVYLVVRREHQPWPPPDFPDLPRSLWLSTLAILTASVAVQSALGAARRGNRAALRFDLALTFALGIAFLGLQTYAWLTIFFQVADTSGPYLKMFYILTGLHAVHVLGGLLPLGLITRRAWNDRYGPGRYAPVRYMAIYWHFLDAVWCLLFVLVYVL